MTSAAVIEASGNWTGCTTGIPAAPAELAVVGVDDIPTAKPAVPPLTTIRFDVHEAGRWRAEAVVAARAGS